MDVAGWLSQLGSERYDRHFVKTWVDTDLLPKLTADDLKDLGIALVEAQMVSSRNLFVERGCAI